MARWQARMANWGEVEKVARGGCELRRLILWPVFGHLPTQLWWVDGLVQVVGRLSTREVVGSGQRTRMPILVVGQTSASGD